MDFASEVTSMPGGEVVRRCFDCGSCTGICPVSESGSGFDPRKILHMIKLGLKDQLLSSPAIWHCTHCDSCAFTCPQELRFSSVADVLREMAINQRYVDEKRYEKLGTAPCKATCPAHISIQGFVGGISSGRYEEAVKLIKEEMPFPGICGRICPHPCETQCNRGKIDEPVAIEFLKRFLADMDISKGSPYVPKKEKGKSQKLAVIGSGPAGLSAAYYLARKGYPVTVFEKLSVAGGMMAVGIPEFRLPRKILQAEIDVIRNLGVEIRLNIEIGKDISFKELKKGYKAIFLAIGCHRPLKLGIPGEDDFTGIVEGLTFLRNINLGTLPVPRGRLVVIGGGNTAIDCARVAKRLGYPDVGILYRRTREEMPANPWEIEETIEEEIDIQFLTAPVKVLGKNRRVSGLECIRMKMGKHDDSGRRRPIPIEGSEFTVQAETVITAIGQKPDLTCLPHELRGDISKSGLVRSDLLTGVTDIQGLFAGGDAVTGPRTVVEAVAFGKEAARSIDHFLKGRDTRTGHQAKWKGIDYVPKDAGLEKREPMPRLSIAERKKTFREIDQGFSEDQAKCEAKRCFSICGIQKML